MNRETRKALESEVARIVPRAINTMKNTYKDDKAGGYLALQDFFLALPFKIDIQEADAETIEQLENSDTYPSIFKWIGGYTKLVKDDNDYKFLKVFVTVTVPRDLESPEEAVKWVKNNIINNNDLEGENALLLIYMHEVMHIMHKHLLPTVNAKFDAIINQYWAKDSKIPEHIKHKIKNFAEDFIINSLLLENAHSNSKLYQLAERVKHKTGEIAFLYNPELSANKGHTVETVIKELIENMEAEEINLQGPSCSCSGNGQSDQNQQGSEGGEQSDQNQDGQNQQGSGGGEQSDQNNQSGKIKGTRYKLKYGDFEYEIWDLHNEGSVGQGEEGDTTKETATAARSVANQVANKLKGSGSAAIAANLGMPIEVTVDWLDKLESDLFKEVRKHTNKVSTTWRRLKNKYRHIAPLPSIVNYENVLNAVVVIDQSGSMGNVELRKINYVIKKLVKRVKQLQVIIHDYDIVYNKKFKYKIEQQLEKELFNKRHAAGGTSHKKVFDVIEDEYQKNKDEDFIVLIFSDMYSDIKEIWNKYEWTVNVKTYLVATEREGARFVEGLPAYVIDMETGQKLN